MRRKDKARKRERAQRQAQDAARRRRAQTAAARAAHSARNHPGIRAHDALVLPEIVRLRGDGLTWRQIAQALQEQFAPPGDRAGYPLGDWHATAAWRIARRHGVESHRAAYAARGALRTCAKSN